MSVAITYDRNDATGGAVPTDATEYTAGVSSVTVIGNTGAMTYAGYNFGGWNTAADGTGTEYQPGETFTIAADTTLYAIWDSATSLITPTGLRGHISSSLTDDSLQEIIDAEEQEIVSRCGAHTSHVETFEQEIPGTLLFPKRPILTVTSVVETVVYPLSFTGGSGEETTTLASDDYSLSSNGKELRRLATGTNARIDWGQRVVVTSVPISESAKRVLALINLCKLNLAFNGLESESVGGGEYKMTMGDYNLKREQIFAGLATAQRSYA